MDAIGSPALRNRTSPTPARVTKAGTPARVATPSAIRAPIGDQFHKTIQTPASRAAAARPVQDPNEFRTSQNVISPKPAGMMDCTTQRGIPYTSTCPDPLSARTNSTPAATSAAVTPAAHAPLKTRVSVLYLPFSRPPSV